MPVLPSRAPGSYRAQAPRTLWRLATTRAVAPRHVLRLTPLLLISLAACGDEVLAPRNALGANSAVSMAVVAAAATDLGTLRGGTFSEARAVNASGQVVGSSNNGEGVSRAARWQQGVIRNLGTLPGTISSFGNGINTVGQIVGFSTSSLGAKRAFLWNQGALTDLGTLRGGNSSAATAIDDNGTVVGYGTTKEGDLTP